MSISEIESLSWQLEAGQVEVFEEEFRKVVGAVLWMDRMCQEALRDVFVGLVRWLGNASGDMELVMSALRVLAGYAEDEGDEALWWTFETLQWVVSAGNREWLGYVCADKLVGLVQCVLGLVGNGQVPGSSRQ